MVLLDSDVNWLTTPPKFRLSFRTQEPITPTQVALLEKILEKEMGQSFQLIFEVCQVE